MRRAAAAFGLAALMLAVAATAQAWSWLTVDLPDVPPTQALRSLGAQPGMTFLDRYGRAIATRGARYGYAVSFSDLPPHVVNAFLAAEDRRFWSHGAVDWRGVARAAVVNLAAGDVREGASTLTQQLARDLFLGRERTLRRKLQEMILAERLYGRLGRRGVLELYLNRVYLGRGAYGVDAAARAWFAKPASALSPGEAAFLAGLPQAPGLFSRDAAAARGRMGLVARRMAGAGWLSRPALAAALATPVAPQPAPPEGDLVWALDAAAAEARTRAAGAHDLVVRLSLDADLQRRVGEAARETLSQAGPAYSRAQTAVVVLGPDGAIRAVIGGRRPDDGPFDRALQARRQPGSAFKPLVWAAALESGVDPNAFRSTRPAPFDGWSPKDHVVESEITVTDALARSSNIVAVSLAREAGLERVAALGRRFGLSGLPDRPGAAVALGVYETRLIDLVGAYQTFQQEGRMTRPWLVESVARTDGVVLYRRPMVEARVYDPGRARRMTRMMQAVINSGTGARARLDRPAAGKTGTSQGGRDAWFIGFTPDVAAGVWIGSDEGPGLKGEGGPGWPAVLWRRVMLAAHQGLPPRPFGSGGPRAPTPTTPERPEEDLVFADRAAFYATLAAEFARVAAPPSETPR